MQRRPRLRPAAWLSGRARSFTFAYDGLRRLWAEPNARVHAAAGLAACGAALLCDLSSLERCAVISAVTLVWLAEALNTALETLADAAVPEHHPLIGAAKDVAAAAVLIAAAGAALVGLVVFLPHLF